MTDIRRYFDKRFLIRYSDAVDESYCVLWAIPIGIAKIMQGMLSERGLWRTTYVKQYHDEYYEVPSFTEWHELEDKIRAFLGGITMSDFCLSTLIEKLDDIATAIQVQGACCQASTNGTRIVEDGSGGFYYGTEDPIAKPDTFGPGEEFETQSEFDAHLCSAANNIVSGLILSLNNWSILSLASLAVGSLVVGVFVANPPLGVLVALGVAAVGFAILATISTHISDNRQAWVCALYDAQGYADMLVQLDVLISDMIIVLDIGPLEIPITDLIHSVIDTDTFNKAYKNVGLPGPIDPIDCDVCTGCTETVLRGTKQSANTYESETVGGTNDQVRIKYFVGPTECEKSVSISTAGSPQPWGITVIYRLYDASGVEIYASDTLPPGPLDAHEVYIVQTIASGPTVYQIDAV